MLLEKIKILYPNVDINKITLYEELATDLIKIYLESINIDEINEDIKIKYSSALFKMIYNAIENEGESNIKQKSQGSKSVTYNTDRFLIVSDDIKGLLPAPRVRFLG